MGERVSVAIGAPQQYRQLLGGRIRGVCGLSSLLAPGIGQWACIKCGEAKLLDKVHDGGSRPRVITSYRQGDAVGS